jgi:hypothetical protein
LVRIFLVKEVVHGNGFPFLVYPSINSLVINIAVNKEVAIPIKSVVANP